MTNWKSCTALTGPSIHIECGRKKEELCVEYETQKEWDTSSPLCVFLLIFFPHQKNLPSESEKRRNIFCNQANIPKPSQGTH